MRNLYIYILLTLTLFASSCVSELADVETNDVGTSGIIEVTASDNVITSSLPEIEWGGESAMSRSSLSFDYTTKTMKFGWESTDKIGVFLIDENVSSPYQTYYQVYEIDSSSPALAQFETADKELSAPSNKFFRAYRPLNEKNDKGFTAIPVSFLDQCQTSNVNMNAYFKKSNTEELEKYKNSEKAAANHLNQYDYNVSSATSRAQGGLDFTFTRLISFVRFYLKVPEAIIYDQLQVVNNDANFIVEAKMDISKTKSSEAFTDATTQHVMSLRFGVPLTDGETTTYTGFDLIDVTGDAYRQDVTPKVGYIVAYMAFAPINLKADNIQQSTLYLVGHSIDGTKKYFRAKNTLSKIDIAQNKIQQWAPTIGDDEPITFEPIQVQEWEEATGVNNGEGGGTEGW